MAKGGGSSRPRFRLLPTVLLTAAILAVPTVVYAWGRKLRFVRHPHRHCERGPSAARQARAPAPATRLPGPQSLHGDRRGRDQDAVRCPVCRAAKREPGLPADAARHRERVSCPPRTSCRRRRWYLVAEDGHVICRRQAGGGADRPPAAAAKAARARRTPPPPRRHASAHARRRDVATTAASRNDRAPATVGADGCPPTGKAAALRARLEAGPRPPRSPSRAWSRDRRPRARAARWPTRASRRRCRIIARPPPALRAGLAVRRGEPGSAGSPCSSRTGPTVTWGDVKRSQAKTLALRAVLARYATGRQDMRLRGRLDPRSRARPAGPQVMVEAVSSSDGRDRLSGRAPRPLSIDTLRGRSVC